MQNKLASTLGQATAEVQRKKVIAAITAAEFPGIHTPGRPESDTGSRRPAEKISRRFLPVLK
jgi:hypothetical protein